MLKTHHLVEPNDLTKKEIEDLLKLANKIKETPVKYENSCKGKILATLFFEPSTRTRLSFESAMHRLGGKVISVADAGTSSIAKGESLLDTIRTINCYSDVIALRHSKEGSAYVSSLVSDVPIINAGDGGHYHPTQTLTDLLTIYNLKGRLDNIVIGFCGDLKFGRTVHSLIKALARYKNVTFILISPKELIIPDYLKKEVLNKKNIKYFESENLETEIAALDILYMTRVQKERFFNESDYIRLKDTYILDLKKLNNTNENLIIMHPLPRVNEISFEIDNDKRAAYFKQAEYGVYIRMALILKLLQIEVK
ncbi:MAG: aspartate carbamoyltransferase [Bacilli bacterium]|nr:aspartate carbamoyltransferase [Bacilli bacterium]